MKFIAIRFWDDSDEETVLGSFDTKQEAQEAIDKDFNDYGSRIFIREHVGYKIDHKEEK